MAAGRWVFPITIVVFAMIMAGFVLSTPTQPALRSGPGDTLFVEYTAFYDKDRGYVFFTTEEELYDQEALRRGPYPIGFNATPVRITLDPTTSPNDWTIPGLLLGRRINETFTTPQFRDYLGRWNETRRVSTTLGEYDRVATFEEGDVTPAGRFNYSRFVTQWGQFQGEPLSVGDEIPCEGFLPWDCRIEALDSRTPSVTYRRVTTPGRPIPAADVLVFSPSTPAPDADVTVVERGADRLALVWDVRPDQSFVLDQGLGDWDAGSYRVESVGGGTASVMYAPPNPSGRVPVPAHLVGEEVWFRFTIVGIEKAA